METPLSDPFLTKKMKMLSKPNGFMLYKRLSVESEWLYPSLKIRSDLIFT